MKLVYHQNIKLVDLQYLSCLFIENCEQQLSLLQPPLKTTSHLGDDSVILEAWRRPRNKGEQF